MAPLRSERAEGGRRVLRPVRPNAGIAAEYRARLCRLIDEMGASVEYWLRAAYRRNEPLIAQDESIPASQLRIAINDLARQWQRRFNEAAPELARYFSLAASQRSDAALRSILKRGGFTVKFTMTPAMRDILRATISQNVGLIRSIPQQYLTQVQGSVMRSVQVGRDLATLARELREQHGVTKRRAAWIALDQNNKATSAMMHARFTEHGIKKAIWVHSHAGKKPRPSHLANDGEPYVVARGWYDPDERKWIWPGELINCRCVSRPIVEGFS